MKSLRMLAWFSRTFEGTLESNVIRSIKQPLVKFRFKKFPCVPTITWILIIFNFRHISNILHIAVATLMPLYYLEIQGSLLGTSSVSHRS